MKDTLGGRANVGKRVALRAGENKIRERIWTHGSTAAAKKQKVKTEDWNHNYDICVCHQGNICVFISEYKSTTMLMFQDRNAGTICVYLGGTQLTGC